MTFAKMPEAVGQGWRNFGRPPKLSRPEQLLLTLMHWREYRAEFHVGLAYGISKHDFKLFKESGLSLPPHVLLLADAGCQGAAKIHPNSQTPFKKTEIRPLSKEQKADSLTLARKRILLNISSADSRRSAF